HRPCHPRSPRPATALDRPRPRCRSPPRPAGGVGTLPRPRSRLAPAAPPSHGRCPGPRPSQTHAFPKGQSPHLPKAELGTRNRVLSVAAASDLALLFRVPRSHFRVSRFRVPPSAFILSTALLPSHR